MTELRAYQRELLGRVKTALAPDRVRVMMQLPTGGGKTIIAAYLLSDWLRDGRKAVWLTHRKELAEQTRAMLADAHISAMTDIRWNPGTDAPAMSHGVVILMAQTVSRRTARRSVWDGYTGDDLLVIDEAHHATADGWARAMQQWPGRIIGMTATPWRLSKKEGFDHLFSELVCGPQTSELQAERWLCEAQVRIPPPDGRILGGEIDRTGEYTESGIERANQNRRDVMTAQALLFWQKHAQRRQTIIYAVSVDHANNLAAVFNDAGIPAGVMLGDTPAIERDKLIADFKDGKPKILVNVAVATEGFDLPDAGCVVLARPTKSLALYLQMAGRGLRPKNDDSNCTLLDLAGNSLGLGLPEDNRAWSLAPRSEPSDGDAPVMWCPHCGAVSAAASHTCAACGAEFGKDCSRCDKWRAWERWSLETHCGGMHDLVCDFCHRDAHIQAHLPVPEHIQVSSRENVMEPDTSSINHSELDDEQDKLDLELAFVLKKILEDERRRITGDAEDRRQALHLLIITREAQLDDIEEMDKLFAEYLDTLPDDQRHRSGLERSYRQVEWHTNLKKELADLKEKVSDLKPPPVDKQLIFANAEERLLNLLRSEAEAVGLFPDDPDDSTFPDAGTSEKQRRRVDWKKLYEDLPIRFSATMLVERSGKPIEQVRNAVSRWKRQGLISKTDDGYRKIDPSIFLS